MSKACLQCGFPLEDNDLPICPSCNLKTLQKIEIERSCGQKKSSYWVIIVGCCILGVFAYLVYTTVINHSKASAKKEALSTAVSNVKSAMQMHDYSEAWKAFQKAKEIDPTCETVTSLMEALQNEPLDVAEKWISQSQFDEARRILIDANKAHSSPDLEKMLKKCDYEQCMSLARSVSSQVVKEDIFGGNFHCWKEAIKTYKHAIAITDTPAAQKELATALEKFGFEESALFVRLHNSINSTIQGGNIGLMAQQMVNINALKTAVSSEDKIEVLVAELKNGVANVEANAEKLARIEEEIKKAKLDGRKQDTVRLIEDALKLVPNPSQKYFQYTGELRTLSTEIKIENPLTPEQSAAIDAKKCAWNITPSAKELMDNGKLLGLKVISVNTGFDSAKKAGNITGVNAYRGFQNYYNSQESTKINSPRDYLDNVLNKNRELVSVEIEVRNSSQSILNVDQSNIKFVDQTDNNYDCASLVDIGANSQCGMLALQPSLKKKLSVMFVVPNNINPKGIRLFFDTFNRQSPPVGQFDNGRFNNGPFNNSFQENKKVQVFSTFDRVEVNGQVLIDKESKVSMSKPVEKPKPTKIIYLVGSDVLKAIKINDFGDIYLITDEDGKSRRLEKKDVSKIEDIENVAADTSTEKQNIVKDVGVLTNERVKIVLKGTGVLKGYIGKVIQASETQIMFQKEGENSSIVSIPLDHINEISKFESNKDNVAMASLDSGNTFFEIADAGIGDKLPVQEKEGQTLFEVRISESNEVHLVVEVKFKDERQNLDILRDKPMPFQVAGVNYVILCPTRRFTAKGYEKVMEKKPFIIITHARHDHDHDHDHNHDHDHDHDHEHDKK